MQRAHGSASHVQRFSYPALLVRRRQRLGRLLMLGLWLTVAGAWHAPASRVPFHVARAAQPRLRPWRMARGASDEPDGKPLPGEERLRMIMFKQGLEEQHLEVRKKARTVHLPFDEAVKWVRKTGADFWGWQSKEDWVEWLHQGEGMSQYIPSDPEAYYGPGGRGGGVEGKWRGWDYWLGTGEYKDHEL